MRISAIKYIYLIIDKQSCIDGNKDPIELAQLAFEISLEYGIKYIQIRDKVSSTAEFIKLASQIKKHQKSHSTYLIINDNVQVCKEIEADGIHLGSNDTNYEDIKTKYPNWIVGKTINSLSEFNQLNSHLLPDYIGVGPVFTTKIKKDKKPIGLQGLNQIANLSNLPIMAIGGINLSNIALFKNIPIEAVAIISQISFSNNPKQTLINLYKNLNETSM